MLNELLDDLYAQFVAIIAKGRNLTEAKVRETIDNGPYCAKDARIFHLVDDVSYFDQFVQAIGEELGGKVTLVRMIVMGEGGLLLGDTITAGALQKAFRTIRENDTVKAVVLRVDSPGGSALVSDLVWREVERTRKAGKPVVASMSDVAASGGYYIAMGADAIVAQPGTITGSIGVVGGKLVLRGLYDKIGVKKETFSRGRNAGLFSDYAPFSDAERKRVEALMSDIYNDFVHKAALGRNIPHEKMQDLATGRVWSARAAKEVGLVDALGGLREAYDLAVEKAGLKGKDVQPVILPREKSLLEAIFAPGGAAVAGEPPRPHALLRRDPLGTCQLGSGGRTRIPDG